MATSADAGAGTPAAQQQRPLPTPEQLAARGESAVKLEFLRMGDRVEVKAVAGSRLPRAAGAAAGGSSAAAATQTGAAPADAQHDPKAKSKKQMKRERAEHRVSTSELCTVYVLGKCTFGSKCKFNHDVDAYLASKPAELPGSCPFNAAERCPYGVTCRFASTHLRPDALTKEFVIDKKDSQPAGQQDTAGAPSPVDDGAQQAQQEAAAAAAPGTGMAAAEAQAPSGAGAGDGAAPAQQTQQAQQHCWWRLDGTIPAGALQLPVPAEAPAEALNVLTKDLQITLRKGQYDFSVADPLLAAMGIRNVRANEKGGRGGRGGRGRGRGQQQGQGQEALAAGVQGGAGAGIAAEAQAAANADPPAAKRQKVEPLAGEPAPAALPQASDAAFLDGLGAPADGAAATEGGPSGVGVGAPADAEGPAVAAGGGTGPAAEGGPSGVVGGDHPREKRSVDFRGKLFLAPLTTVGNLPFRRLCKSLGADVTCGEMALGTNLLQGQPSEWALLKRHKDEDLFGVQLCGGYADTMARCAQVIEEKCQVDFVDLNFGCPIDLVCSKGAGSACLLRPQKMEQIVRSMSSVLSCPLTFKMRKGYNDGQDIAHTLVPKAAEWGAAAITLHGRTREQRYSRLADWPYIKQCVDAAAPTGIQMIGNGDVFSFEDHFRHLEECPGLATTYIARGALIKPWIFTEIKEQRHWDISAGERLDYLKRFCAFGLEHWGSDSRGVESTRRFLLEWLSFTHRYIPVGLLEVVPQRMHLRPPAFVGRSDLETLLASDNPADWLAISEMLLGPAPEDFVFAPKHKANSYASREGANLAVVAGGGAAAQPAQEEEY